jgi:hypothetical protein
VGPPSGAYHPCPEGNHPLQEASLCNLHTHKHHIQEVQACPCPCEWDCCMVHSHRATTPLEGISVSPTYKLAGHACYKCRDCHFHCCCSCDCCAAGHRKKPNTCKTHARMDVWHQHTFTAAVFVGMQYSRAHQLQTSLQAAGEAHNSSVNCRCCCLVGANLGLKQTQISSRDRARMGQQDLFL